MKKGNEEDENKTKGGMDKQQIFIMDYSKYAPFIEEIKSKNYNSPEYLGVSIKNSITPQDSIMFTPKNIHFIPTKYPTSPLPLKTDSMEKFDVDTLFFIFFIQQDAHLRYLAAKELKKRGWMYHKKFFTFFQLQGQPKNKSEEFIEGKFKFFDFEEDWMIRMKKDFKFEFKYLDNID